MPLFARRVLFAAAFFCATRLAAQNVVQRENMKAGSADWVLASPATNHEIEGYASATSVNRGEQIRLYVSTPDPTYTINIYRTGWYGGVGARKVAGPIVRTGTLQPIPAPDPSTGLIECHWSDPYVVSVPDSSDPTDWASGVYLAKLTSGTTNRDAYIVFVIRDDARPATHYFQASVTTYEAYNEWGGKSLYAFNSTANTPATRVSFNRPYLHGSGAGDYLFRWEYNMVRFLEREGYDVSYCTDIDTHRRGSLIASHRDFLVVGHDEYWSDEMRTNVIAARDSGTNIGFLSANTCYWQIRLAPSSQDASQLDRTMIAYKEAYTRDPYFTDHDPSNDHLVTTSWRSAPVNDSEDAFEGVMYVADPVNGDIVIDDVTSTPWLFDGTGLVSGSKLPGLLGYEVDKLGPRSPTPITRLGHSLFTTNKSDGQPNITDYSDMTIYTAGSGALVFATGSIQFALGLDNWNASANGDRTSAAAQQMTRNLLERFAGADASRDCQFALSPAASSVNAKSGTGAFSITTFCSWSAAADVSWITLASATSGEGSATITFSYDANTTAQTRTGHIQVGDRVYTLTQGRPCAYSVSPSSFDFGPAGGAGSVAITTDPNCSWSAGVSTSYPWITITGGASGTGSGTTTFSVASYNGATSRTGQLSVAANAVSVTQAVAPAAPVAEAHATSANQVLVSWPASSGATGYEVYRRSAGTSFSLIGTPAASPYVDQTVTPGAAYLYRVRAVNQGGASVDSVPDIATAIVFTDDPIVSGATIIKAKHLQELRAAVAAVANLAGTDAGPFTDSANPGVIIRAVQINELRTTLDNARRALSFSTGGYTDTLDAGIVVKATHFQEIRTRVK